MSNKPIRLNDSATLMHEQYTALLKVGFTPNQALYLIAAMVCGGPKPPTGTEKVGSR